MAHFRQPCQPSIWTLLAALLFVAGCRGDSGAPVDIVVPKAFTGQIWIILDSNGQDIPLVKGRYQVVIPPDGVLRVQSFQPFEQWHESSARYADGAPLPEASVGMAKSPEVIALRDGDSVVTQRNGKDIRWMQFFVGTAKQYSESTAMGVPPDVGH